MILNNGNTTLYGTVSMTPIGSKITLESAKTNRLQPCLLHSSSALLTHTLPFKAAVCADRFVEAEVDKT